MRGFTIIELLLAIAIMVIASAIAVPFYDVYAQRAEQTQAATDLMRIDMTIERFSLNNGGGNVQGQVRKDQNLNPINSDFDLYSIGPDGSSVAPLTAAPSRDDIVRAGNGSFFGVAEDF